MISHRQASRACGLILFALCCIGATAQSEAGSTMERTFPYSAEAVNKALEQVGGFRGGTLPMAEGFVAANLADLERYQRPYYQFRVHLNPGEANSTVLQVEARISAWYADPDILDRRKDDRVEQDLRVLVDLFFQSDPGQRVPYDRDHLVNFSSPASGLALRIVVRDDHAKAAPRLRHSGNDSHPLQTGVGQRSLLRPGVVRQE